MNIEYTFTGAGRRKRESERQGRQMNGMVGPITISKTNNNLVDMVKINLMKLLGNDGVDTYYYYDVSLQRHVLLGPGSGACCRGA